MAETGLWILIGSWLFTELRGLTATPPSHYFPRTCSAKHQDPVRVLLVAFTTLSRP